MFRDNVKRFIKSPSTFFWSSNTDVLCLMNVVVFENKSVLLYMVNYLVCVFWVFFKIQTIFFLQKKTWTLISIETFWLYFVIYKYQFNVGHRNIKKLEKKIQKPLIIFLLNSLQKFSGIYYKIIFNILQILWFIIWMRKNILI